ncbi:MAG TPA: aspartyl protease family protein [Terracidiphilus sp.]|nr:aspartyl protease family protein [Terracidiphilus sp.]
MSRTTRILIAFVFAISVRNTTTFTYPIPFAAFGETRCPGNIPPVRYRSLTLGQMAIPVSINHSGPYDFMVDTGTQLNVIDPSLAADLHLQSQGTIGVLAVSQWTDEPWVTPELIEAGPYAVHSPIAVVVSLKQIQSHDPKVRGILGENFLEHFDLLIDHVHKVLCFDESKQMQDQLQGDRLPIMAQTEHQGPIIQPQLIRIPILLRGIDSRTRIFRLDSGASVAVLYDSQPAKGLREPGNHALRGHVAGERAQYFAALPDQDIRIGTRLLTQVAFVALLGSVPGDTPDGEDGLLPTRLFDRVFISFADHYVILNPR